MIDRFASPVPHVTDVDASLRSDANQLGCNPRMPGNIVL